MFSFRPTWIKGLSRLQEEEPDQERHYQHHNHTDYHKHQAIVTATLDTHSIPPKQK
jgi:hypothetical protein